MYAIVIGEQRNSVHFNEISSYPGMLGEGAMETTEENSVDSEVVMSEEDVLRKAVKLRSEEAGVEGARNTQVFS